MRTPTSSMLAQLDEQVGRWNLLQHPFYKDWQAGRLDRNALQIYAAQYGRHVKAFPEHLQQLAARCEGETRDLVMENLAEELHPQGPHPQLWRDFACAVGTSELMLDHSPTLPGVQTLVESYRRLLLERSKGCGTFTASRIRKASPISQSTRKRTSATGLPGVSGSSSTALKIQGCWKLRMKP